MTFFSLTQALYTTNVIHSHSLQIQTNTELASEREKQKKIKNKVSSHEKDIYLTFKTAASYIEPALHSIHIVENIQSFRLSNNKEERPKKRETFFSYKANKI